MTKIPNWTKEVGKYIQLAWSHSSGEFIISCFWQRGSDMSCELNDADWNTLCDIFYYTPPATVTEFKKRIYDYLRNLQDVEDLRLLTKMDGFFTKMVLEKCVNDNITVRQYVASDDAKHYDLFRRSE